jgi:hypothetical protein
MRKTLSGDQTQTFEFKGLNTNQFQKYNYTYNQFGQLQKEISEYYYMGSFIPGDSSWYNYDAWGNRINSVTYNINTGIMLQSDTSTFQPGTNKITRFVQYLNYSNTASPLNKERETFIHYTGNAIDYVDVWNTFASSTCEWKSRKKYFFNSTGVNEIQTFLVSGGVLDPNPEYKTLITFNTNGEPKAFNYFENNVLMRRDSLEYDSDYFLKKVKLYIGNSLNFGKIENYYFQNTLSISEVESKQETVNVFPNPASEFIQLESTANIIDVQLFNMNGQLLIRQNSNEIDLSRLESGTYLLIGQTDLGSFSKKIVKE